MEKPLLNRREFITSAVALGGTAALPEILKAQESAGYIAHQFETIEGDWDATELLTLLEDTETIVADLTEREQREFVNFLQWAFSQVSGKNGLQEAIPEAFDGMSTTTAMVVFDKETSVQTFGPLDNPKSLLGRFMHESADAEGANLLLMRGDIPAIEFLQLICHEAMHGVCGDQEHTTSAVANLLLLCAVAKKDIPSEVFTASNGLHLFSPDLETQQNFRAAFISNGLNTYYQLAPFLLLGSLYHSHKDLSASERLQTYYDVLTDSGAVELNSVHLPAINEKIKGLYAAPEAEREPLAEEIMIETLDATIDYIQTHNPEFDFSKIPTLAERLTHQD